MSRQRPGASPGEQLVAAARALCRQVDPLTFAPPVSHVYNPLAYARACHEAYLVRFGNTRKRVLFVGMNPGPFGMVQTGIPFGEIAAVRDWLGIQEAVGRPSQESPGRPVEGFACPRSEVSGRRLWGLFAERFGTAERFFADHFVVNYCPLAFLAGGTRNLTPDKLPAHEAEPLLQACDAHLARQGEILQPDWVIGVGGFAAERAEQVLSGRAVRVGRILHPSPASPAANRDWAGQATRQLQALGIWR